MNKERLEALIDLWEPPECEVVRAIESYDTTVERVVKFPSPRTGDTLYSLYRYFELGIDMADGSATSRTEVSVDLLQVDADRIIQHLAERL